MTEPTPWAALLNTACAHGIPPASFWRLSLSEWRALTVARQPQFTHTDFDALAQRFPDNADDRSNA